ncbi:hypothetical protein [Winogradskyella sp.]|uniref:hypothetical protein n=1 Tax=Winogradskyella sp. TaxID=1883156 RepID=UPI003BAD28DB
MKRALALFFTILYVLAMVKPAVPVIEFYLNQDFIAEFLCINKDKPKLQCNGKCQLSKMIEDANTETDKVPTIDLREYPIALIDRGRAETVTRKQFSKRDLPLYASHYKYLYKSSLLKPPRV